MSLKFQKFSDFYIENRLFSYICDVRKNPGKYVHLLEEMKKNYDGLKYKAKCFDGMNGFPEKEYMTKNGVKSVDEAIELLRRVEKEVTENDICKLVPDLQLNKYCSGFSPNVIKRICEHDAYVFESEDNTSSDIVCISIPYRKYFETSQQILLNILVNDENLSFRGVNYRSLLFGKSVCMIGVGTFSGKSRGKAVQIMMFPKLKKVENKCQLNELAFKKWKLKLPGRKKKKNKDTSSKKFTLLEVEDELYLDDNEPSPYSVKIEFKKFVESGDNVYRNGTKILTRENNELEYKAFVNSYNIGVKELRVDKIKDFVFEKTQKYIMAFQNKLGGDLVFGVTENDNDALDNDNMLDGVCMKRLFGKIDDCNFWRNLYPEHFKEVVNVEYKWVKLKSNFKDIGVFCVSVPRIEGLFLFRYDEKKCEEASWMRNGTKAEAIQGTTIIILKKQNKGLRDRLMRGEKLMRSSPTRGAEKEEEEVEDEGEEVDEVEEGIYKLCEGVKNMKKRCKYCGIRNIKLTEEGVTHSCKNNTSRSRPYADTIQLNNRRYEEFKFRHRIIYDDQINCKDEKKELDKRLALEEGKCSVCGVRFKGSDFRFEVSSGYIVFKEFKD